MQYISATDAKQSFAATIDMAQQEPVVIRRQNRDVAVIVSPQDYARLTRLNLSEFQEFRSEVSRRAAKRGLTKSKLNKLLEKPE